MGTLPQAPEGAKSAAGQFGLALLVSANAVAVLSHGMLGLGATFTGTCYVASIALLFCLGRWNAIVLTPADYLALALFLLYAISSAVHPPADFRQAVLLSVALAAYPAARGLASPAHGSIFKLVLAAILGAGCPATAVALAASSDGGDKPLVFGQYGAAPASFAILLAVLIFALACSQIKIRLIALAIVGPVVISAASQVRFALVAMVASTIIGAIAAPRLRRRFILTAGTVMIFVLAGMGARPSTSIVFLSYAASSFDLPILTKLLNSKHSIALSVPISERCGQVNLNNSIDIRKQLYREAFSLVPSAGFAGIGLGHFPEYSCLDNTEVHNSILQTAVEIGIPAGILLAALMAAVFRSLWPLAKESDDALFALCLVSFAVLISFTYGHVTNDVLLFAALGYGAAMAGAAKLERRDVQMQAMSEEVEPLQQAAAAG
jgi:O-Antigen ligase